MVILANVEIKTTVAAASRRKGQASVCAVEAHCDSAKEDIFNHFRSIFETVLFSVTGGVCEQHWTCVVVRHVHPHPHPLVLSWGESGCVGDLQSWFTWNRVKIFKHHFSSRVGNGIEWRNTVQRLKEWVSDDDPSLVDHCERSERSY